MESHDIKKIVETSVNYINSQIDNLIIIYEIILLSFKAATVYDTGYIRHFVRGYRLARTPCRFRAHEAFNIGLFSPEIREEDIINYSSKNALSTEQAKINPASWFDITESKDIFYRYCMMLDVPVPDLYAIYYKRSSGWTRDNEYIANNNEWSNYIRERMPETFVIKPARGVYGHGFSIYRRVAENFLNTQSISYTAESLINSLSSDNKYTIFILQEYLKNHPDITSLSGSEYLQTFRIITFVERSGSCQILFSVLKIITGSSSYDNFEGGITGNLVARVNIDEGTIYEVRGPSLDKPGYSPNYEYPDINDSIDGFEIPFWQETCQCIKEAAFKFLPIRTIGWDVAITPNGPVIVEANIRWDPMFPNMYAEMGKIIACMREE